jgi:hypothetical protein
LRGSATHHVVHFLEIAVHALSAQTAQFDATGLTPLKTRFVRSPEARAVKQRRTAPAPDARHFRQGMCEDSCVGRVSGDPRATAHRLSRRVRSKFLRIWRPFPMRFGSWIASDPSHLTTSGEMVRAGDCIADHVLSTTRRRMSRRWRRTMLAATISEQPPQLRPIECYLSSATYRVLPIGASWDRPISSPGVPSVSCKRRSRAFAICIAKSVELMRDRQIEGLPCELVAPVRLLLEETRVLHSNPP